MLEIVINSLLAAGVAAGWDAATTQATIDALPEVPEAGPDATWYQEVGEAIATYGGAFASGIGDAIVSTVQGTVNAVSAPVVTTSALLVEGTRQGAKAATALKAPLDKAAGGFRLLALAGLAIAIPVGIKLFKG